MAKTKTGYNAAMSKDHSTVKNSWKNTLTIIALVAVATFAQMRIESATVPEQNANKVVLQGRNLASRWESEETVNYGDLLQQNIEKWK